MVTTQNIAIGVALVLLVWYFAGLYVNRIRAQQLLRAIRDGIGQVGAKSTVKWFGRAAFQVDVGEPVAPFVAFRLLCLLEPRDFPLAQVWSRLRGRRDQVMIHADFARAPAEAGQPDPRSFGIAGLTGVTLRKERPHVELTLQVGRGGEGAIGQALGLAARLRGPVK